MKARQKLHSASKVKKNTQNGNDLRWQIGIPNLFRYCVLTVRAMPPHGAAIQHNVIFPEHLANTKTKATSTMNRSHPVASTCTNSRPAAGAAKTTLPRRSVSFSPKVRALVIPPLDAYSDRHREQLWQTSQEKKASEAEVIQTIRAARQGKVSDDASTRGLEHLTIPGNIVRLRQRREQLITAVCDNQDEQWRAGIFHAHPEIIRVISIHHTHIDTNVAITRAAEDEAYVRGTRRLEAYTSISAICNMGIKLTEP